jgi:hypothetical protein
MGEADNFSRFETMGIDMVRDFAPQWLGGMQHDAYKWLRSRDEELRLANDSSQAEMAAAASRAATAAERAATAAEAQARTARQALITAIAATIIAAIALIVSILGVLHFLG